MNRTLREEEEEEEFDLHTLLQEEDDGDFQFTFGTGSQFISEWDCALLVKRGDVEDDEKEPKKEDDATASTFRDSFSSRESIKSPKLTTPTPHVMSPMERARLRLSQKSATESARSSARSERRAIARMSLNTLALKSLTLDDLEGVDVDEE